MESTAPTGTSATIGLLFKHSNKLVSSILIKKDPSEFVVVEYSPESFIRLKFWSINISAPEIYPSMTSPEKESLTLVIVIVTSLVVVSVPSVKVSVIEYEALVS